MSIRYEKSFLLSELQRFYRLNGRIPKARELNNKNGYPNWISYRTHFGSLRNALLEAELPLDTFRIRPKKYSDLDLIKSLADFRIKFGRYPVYSDLNKRGKYVLYPHVRTYESRFGKLSTAIHIALEMAVNETDSEKGLKEIIDRVNKEIKTKVSCNPTKYNVSFTIEEINHLVLSLRNMYCDVCNRAKTKLIKVKERKINNE